MSERIRFGGGGPQATTGSAGIRSQLPGQAATVGALSAATGGIKAGSAVEPAKG